tara:strand:- start:627 stop:920 length:294 start_codon:yes stop_codon:yes gene_type:complete
MKNIIIVIFAGILLSGCATTYQSTGLTGGYEDIDLGGGRYKVTFVGNGYTSDDRAIEFAKKRSSELCNGAFDTLEKNVESTSFMGKPSVTLIIQCKT